MIVRRTDPERVGAMHFDLRARDAESPIERRECHVLFLGPGTLERFGVLDDELHGVAGLLESPRDRERPVEPVIEDCVELLLVWLRGSLRVTLIKRTQVGIVVFPEDSDLHQASALPRE